jgi:hypothetical protein
MIDPFNKVTKDCFSQDRRNPSSSDTTSTSSGTLAELRVFCSTQPCVNSWSPWFYRVSFGNLAGYHVERTFICLMLCSSVRIIVYDILSGSIDGHQCNKEQLIFLGPCVRVLHCGYDTTIFRTVGYNISDVYY